MKICHILWGLTYGGIETMVINIANCQADMGHEVHLLIVNDKVDAALLGRIGSEVTFHNVGRKVGSRNPMPLVRLNALLWRMRPDVTHFHHVRLPHYVLKPAIGKWCVTYHTDYVEDARADLLRIPNLFSISNEASSSIERNCGKKSTLVLNGIETGSFRVKTEFFRGGRTFRIVQVGRLLPQVKGQYVLIDAVKHLRSKGLDVMLDLIGDGSSRDELSEYVEKIGMSGIVRLLGAIDQQQLKKRLAEYDLLVQPSFLEGFGLTIVEAMAAHLPVLVSDIPPQMEVVDKGKCGWFFESGNVDDCADKISRIMSTGGNEKVADAAKRVAELYDVRATARCYLLNYKSL